MNHPLVVAMVQNSGNNNNAGAPTAVAPLTLVSNGFWGSQWGSAATGRQFVTAPRHHDHPDILEQPWQ